MVNVYAPSNHLEREDFYHRLAKWEWQDQPRLIAGDFNCVLSPILDRWGGKRSDRSESAKLQHLTQLLQLEDALTMTGHAEEEAEPYEPTEFFTFWGPEVASRFDRFYVPDEWTDQVQWVEVREPVAPSDHQCVQLHLQDPADRIKRRKRKRGLVYPLRTSQPERVAERLMDSLTEAGVGREVNSQTWDATVQACAECVRTVDRLEKKQRERFRHKYNVQKRAHLLTRRELLDTTMEDERQEQLVRMGNRLERTTEQLRWNFKRVSNWEKDQTITEIQRMNGGVFSRGMSTADKFKSEWKPIVARIHNETRKEDMNEEFDKFVRIPKDRQVSLEENMELMQEITQEEVIQAFAELNRHKAAGPDGLNNDFYKDMQALLVPAMVVIGNEILQGGEPPSSFLEGLIIPLRKKGDSADAMDYRPITLLQTGYKIIARVIANRTQRIMGTLIGNSQQGFVKGRQMLKTVMMMLAMLATAQEQPQLVAGLSRLILLLDFRNAYDTVAREFLFTALTRFGFSADFVHMIKRLHDGTTAKFLVNGELSEPLEVVSGIRQGCALAPLLFIIAAEVLALAIQQDTATAGLDVPGSTGAKHKFSAFVDDSTVFLQQAQQLPRIMTIVKQFGKLSVLQVQPTRSKIIFLNTAVALTEYMGIPVSQHGETTRYLGYQVGTGDLTNVKWAGRIRAIQRRLATATQLSTTIDNRVTLLDVIMLPAVLFTAAAFEMPQWADKQIRNLQKQFLWRHSTSTESSRHKMNPALVFTPRQAGGVGLASVQLACLAQRAKHTIQWLVQRQDSYYSAWREWAFREAHQPWKQGISPRVETHGRRKRNRNGPGDTLQDLIGTWVVSKEIDEPRMAEYTKTMENLATEAISWSTDEEWIVELQHELPQPLAQATREEKNFWPTYMWTENPGVVDQTGQMLLAAKYDRIQPCAMVELRIQRTGVRTYSMIIPTRGERSHSQAKLRRWALAILGSSPSLAIGEVLQTGKEVHMRHQPQLEHDYTWVAHEPGTIIGTQIRRPNETPALIQLTQQPYGLHWQVKRRNDWGEETTADTKKLQRNGKARSIVFVAHPALHRFHWEVPDTTANKHVGEVIKKQAFRRYKGQGSELGTIVKHLQGAARDSKWQEAALQQTPKKLWAHKHELTDYQVWVGYRLAVRQLNLFHEDRLRITAVESSKTVRGARRPWSIFFGTAHAPRRVGGSSSRPEQEKPGMRMD